MVLQQSYKQSALAVAHLEQNVRSWSSIRETMEKEIFKQGQGTQWSYSLCLGHTSSLLWPFLADKIHIAVTLQMNVPSDECICSATKPSRGWVCKHSASSLQMDDTSTDLTLLMFAELLSLVLTYSGLHWPPAVLPENTRQSSVSWPSVFTIMAPALSN